MIDWNAFFREGLARWVVFGMLGWLALYIGPRANTFAGGADSSGYLEIARSLTQGKLLSEPRPIGGIPMESLVVNAYQPLGFTMLDHRRMAPMYPFGFPILIAALYTVFEEENAQMLAILLVAGLTLWGTYLVGRELRIGTWWSAASTALVGVCPLFVFFAPQAMSDVFSTCLMLFCVWMGLRIGRHWGYAAGLGFLFSWLVVARLPNVALGLPLLYLIFRSESWRRRWWVVAAGGLPGLAFLLSLNEALYGNPFMSGYSGIYDAFSTGYVSASLWHYAKWFGVVLAPWVFWAFVASPVLARRSGGLVALLWLWTLPLLAFYAFYAYTDDAWWYLRFVMPALPALALGGCWVLSVGCERIPWRALRVAAALGLIGGAAYWEWGESRKLALLGHRSTWGYVKWIEWAEENLPERSPVVSSQYSGATFYHLPNPIVRYDWMTPESWRLVKEDARRSGVPLFAVLEPFELEYWDPSADGGDWELAADLGNVWVYRMKL